MEEDELFVEEHPATQALLSTIERAWADADRHRQRARRAKAAPGPAPARRLGRGPWS
ncbi:hypothetical protein [Longispora albida]|uniref:hypothetical protein n=1 Tax=Longispora albida TaxID=203523 RepID=UPI0003805DA7|nr:hypothetical protein [Longispora albida]